MSKPPGWLVQRPPSDFPRSAIYLVADPDACTDTDHSLIEGVAQALEAGVGIVQYRLKGTLTSARVDEAAALREQTQKAGAIFLVNDRVDLALMVAADGVHLGQDDLPVDEARTLLPDRAWIGLSTHNLHEAEAALAAGVDYIGFGNVFGTTSKADALPPCGVTPLTQVCAAIPLPVYAIGGVSLANLPQVAQAGAAGGAVIGAILKTPDPQAAAKALLARW